MSFLGKKWVIRGVDGGELVERVLRGRGLWEERRELMDYDVRKLHDPMLMKGMEVAVSRIRRAVSDGEKVMIFGDYDVDGISGTAVLVSFLREVGANVEYTLPHRENDGYGLKEKFVRNFAENGVKLIVTVDCGTASAKEVALANELGMEVIVTDHHDIPPTLPEALALLNPKQTDCPYPNRELSGSAVAYKLASALIPHYMEGAAANEMMYKLLGLAALGLVSDCMALTGENRVLVKHGLSSLMAGYHPGVQALLEEAGQADKEITSQTIGFVIAPRLNAAGRMDRPEHALELLLGDLSKVETLAKLNGERREVVEVFLDEARAQVEMARANNGGQTPAVIVVSSGGWHSGILGLVAGRMCEEYSRPTVAMQEKDPEWVASCRSLNAFDITAFLREAGGGTVEAGGLFSAFGGHMLAGGFSIPSENVEELKRRVAQKAPQALDVKSFHGMLELDCAVSARELTLRNKELLDELQPFGMGNPQPTLMLSAVKISEVRPVGKTGDHLQLPLEHEGQQIQAIAFRFGAHAKKISVEKAYDVAIHLEINEWQGRKKVQVRVLDMRETI